MNERPLSGRELLHAAAAAIRARIWLVVASLLLMTAALLALRSTAPTYQASVKLTFNPANIIQALFQEPREGVLPPNA